jgi:LPXTG-motif cell wall-anchored protein
MSIFTKLFKGMTGTTKEVAQTKSTRAAAAANVKDFASGGLKTTSAIGSQGVTKATAGGAQVFKSSVKVSDNTAKIGNNLVKAGGYTAVAAIPALGAIGLGSMGIGLYNNYKTAGSLTDEDRRDIEVGKNYIDYLKGLSGLGITVGNTTGNPNVDSNPTSMGNTGVGGSSFMDPYAQKDTEDSGSSFGLLGIAGVVLLGGGAYYLLKKKKSN